MSALVPPQNSLPPLVRGAILLVLLISAGCANRSSLVGLSQGRSQAVRFVADRESGDDGGYAGPLERALRGNRWEKEKSEAVANGDAFAIDGLHEYQAAESLYLDGRYSEAEKAFKRLAKERRRRQETVTMKFERLWGIRSKQGLDTYTNFGDPIEEDSMFMRAECQYEQKKFAAAQDSYDALLDQYPSTRHLDTVSRRYFRIARYWLGFPEDVNEKGEVEVASASSQEPKDFDNTDAFYIPVVPNLTDKTRPMFDTWGRALAALRSVWLHDATGPLADDALMVSASFHLRTRDFEESARLYKLLREQYPESPHFQDAFLLGSHVTLASYQGSNYDGQSLDEAIELKEAALRIFPDLSEEERNRLGGELQKMYDAEVARIWDRVEYFQAKNAPQSVEVYCNILINRFPDTVYAERARKILQAQAAQGPSAWIPSAKPSPEPDANAGKPAEKKPGLFPGLNWNFRKVQDDPPAEVDQPVPEQAIERSPQIEQPTEEAEETDESEEQPPSGSRRSRVESASAGRATLD